MGFEEAEEGSTSFPFNYCVDNELLTFVLTTEVYLIPFHKTRAAFDAIREQMITSGGFCAMPSHHHAPSTTSIPASATQLLERYRHLITNHPSRDVSATKHPFHESQLKKRSRLLNQIFSKIINAIYPRGVGRPPRKYSFNDFLDVMLLEQILQRTVHLLPRSDAIQRLPEIRQYMVEQCDFPDVPPTPAPSSPAKGPPTVPQLTVRYQQLISSHVNVARPVEIDAHRDPELERKLYHLLDVIVRGIVKQALSGPNVINKDHRNSIDKNGLEFEQFLSRRAKRRRMSAPARAKTEPEAESVSPVTPSRPYPALKEIKKSTGNGFMEDTDSFERKLKNPLLVTHVTLQKLNLEERRLALEEDIQKQNHRRLAVEEERQKIDSQRLKIQEDMLQQLQKEHKSILTVLTGITSVLSSISEKLQESTNNKETEPLKQDVDASNIASGKEVVITVSEEDKMLDAHNASQSEKFQATQSEKSQATQSEKAQATQSEKVQATASLQEGDNSKEDDGAQKPSSGLKHEEAKKAEKTEEAGGVQKTGCIQEAGSEFWQQ